MLVKEAKEAANISKGNSKMPGSTFATDSFACRVGSKLAKLKGSVCESCYARRIQKLRPSVNIGWKANYEKATRLIAHAPEKWVAACAFQINRIAKQTGENYHRWFDSGDLDSVDMLRAICSVAEQTPTIKHWLPTREIGIVSEYARSGGIVPSNLIIRVSSPMIGDKPLSLANTSTVHREGQESYGHKCPAPTQGNNCGDCRACWNSSVKNISYTKH